MKFSKFIKAGRLSAKISVVWREDIQPVAPPDVTPQTLPATVKNLAGPDALVVSGFDPIPQRERPLEFLLVEEPDGEISIGGWSIQQFVGGNSYGAVRKFDNYDDALDAWMMLRRGASVRRIRSHAFKDPKQHEATRRVVAT